MTFLPLINVCFFCGRGDRDPASGKDLREQMEEATVVGAIAEHRRANRAEAKLAYHVGRTHLAENCPHCNYFEKVNQ